MWTTNVTKDNLGPSITPHNQQNPYIKFNKFISKLDSSIIFSNPNKDTQSKRSKARNMKYIKKEAEPIPFLEDWLRNGDLGRGRDEQDDE